MRLGNNNKNLFKNFGSRQTLSIHTTLLDNKDKVHTIKLQNAVQFIR